MVQSILFFLLGFLCAGFLALLIAPAVWRRAVRMTRKRIEASVPLSLADIQADKDRLRAEFAMSTRRLEVNFRQFREKAAQQMIDVTRRCEELKALAAQHGPRDQAMIELESKAGELRAELLKRDESLREMSGKLAAAERSLGERGQELDRLSRLHDDATFNSSSRQIELVARESDVDRLSDEQRDAEHRLQDALAQTQAMQAALDGERKRNLELGKKNEAVLATLAEREQAIDRADRDSEALRAQLNALAADETAGAGQTASADGPRAAAQANGADHSTTLETMPVRMQDGEPQKTAAAVKKARSKLKQKAAALEAENSRVQDQLAALAETGVDGSDAERRSGAALRDQMSDLAAEVVRLAALIEGRGGPVDKALSTAPVFTPEMTSSGKPSLADRIRALQQHAAL